jgi:hypothetical protein
MQVASMVEEQMVGVAVTEIASNNHIKSPFGLGRSASLRAPYVWRYTANGQ